MDHACCDTNQPPKRSPRGSTRKLRSWSVLLFLSLFIGLAQAAWCQGSSGSWQGADIGSPSTAGSESLSNSTLTITGGGSGVYGAFAGYTAGDHGHFTYQPVTGDVEIIARVQSFSGTGKAEVGLMLRESTDPQANMACTLFQGPSQSNENPNFVQACRRPGNQWNPFAYDTWSGTEPPINPPFWLKLTRIGANYTTYRSSDGLHWCPIQDTAGGGFATTSSYQAGFFISSGSSGTATAVIDSISIGAPLREYTTSWVGNTFSDDVNRYVSNNLDALYVTPDGTCYSNGLYDEAGEPAKVYKDGRIVQALAYGGGLVTDGSITGDSQYLYVYTGIHQDSSTSPPYIKVVRSGLDGSAGTTMNFASTPTLGNIGGMAAVGGKLYCSDVVNNRIRVLDATTAAEVPSLGFDFDRPGPMAVDSRGDLWIIQRAMDYPIGFSTSLPYVPAILCYHTNGTFTGKAITDVENPWALCVDPTADRLLVCDNGQDRQNIRIYTGLATMPAFNNTFGTAGGIFTGGTPGLINDTANGGYTRLFGPCAIGVDASGNMYISCRGTGTHLRKFDPSGNLVWSLSGLPFTQCPDFDPTTDGQDLYWQYTHYTLDYTKTTPGSEWSYTGLSWNPFGVDAQGRPDGGAVFRRFGPNNDRFMFVMPAKGGPVYIYRYSGELAIPCGRIDQNNLWVDLNGDGKETPDEDSPLPSPWGQPSFDVDNKGDVYVLQSALYDYAAGKGIIRHFHFQGLSSQGVPLYSTAAYEDQSIPAAMAYPTRFRYDQASDTMYFLGYQVQFVNNPNPDTMPGQPAVAAYTNWSQPSRAARFFTLLPTPYNDPNFFYFDDPAHNQSFPSGDGFQYYAMDAVGDKIFVGELWGPIHVYDAMRGNEVTRLLPGAEVSGVEGWTDIFGGIRAFQRSTGEYEVVREDAGYRARNLMFRWTPHAVNTLSARTNLTAEGGSDRVRLTWNGPFGLVQKYAVWRGTASGQETLLADNLTQPQFDDTTVQFGVPYYYEVTASNSLGTSGFSNEAMATANTSAAFARIDTSTIGNWLNVYGTQGYTVVNDSASYPASIQVTPTGATPFVAPELYTWATSSTDPNALQRASGTGRVGSIWHQGNTTRNVQVELNLTDGQLHQVGLYIYDWLNYPNSSLQVDIYDDFGKLINTQTILQAGTGKYAIWNLSGHLHLVFTPGSPPLEVSGLFIDGIEVAPAAPTSPQAMLGAQQIQLSWNASSGASSYRVYRSTTQGGPYQQIAGGITTTGYVDSTVAGGTTYYYVITAANAGGESAYSAEVGATTPQIPPITIDPGSYTGRYVLIGTTRTTYTGKQTLNLSPGTYFIDNGASIGGSAFSFDVTNAGQVANVSNTTAATANGSTLTFNTASVSIQPGAYTGRYLISAYFPQSLTGPQTVVLIAGLAYNLDNGSTIGGSAFSFTVADSSGTITQISIPAAATASGNTITFNNSSLKVDPQSYTGSYSLSSYFINGQTFSGVHSFVMIPGLVYAADNTGAPGGSAFSFTLDANGVITAISNSSSVFGVGGTTLYFGQAPPPPAPPPFVTAIPDDGKAHINWNASSGATSYNVYRSTTKGGPYQKIATGVTTTSYHDSPLVNGTTYYYVITAVNAGGESGYSPEVSVTPGPAPATPTDLAAATCGDQVTLTWTASAGASFYEVKRSTTSGGPYLSIAFPAETTFADTTAANGTTYFYVVAARYGATTSADSSEVSITPQNLQPVTLTAPADISRSTDSGQCSATISSLGTPTTNDNCAGVMITSQRSDGHNVSDPYPVGQTTITWMLSDAYGNTATATQKVTVVVTQPTITAPPDIVHPTDPGQCSATIFTNGQGFFSLGTPTTSDSCPGVTFTAQRSDGHNANDPYPPGLTTVTWTMTDSYGSTATATQKVTVVDQEPPKITIRLGDYTTNTDPGQCSAVRSLDASAFDNCSGSVPVTGTRSDGKALTDPYPAGVTTITWSATDAAGNTATAPEKVTVIDNQPPTLTPPSDIVHPTDPGQCSATIFTNGQGFFSLGTPTYSDNCPGVTVSAQRSDGHNANDPYPLGLTTVTWTAVDAAGNQTSATQKVTVVDQAPPVITVRLGDITTSTDPGVCTATRSLDASSFDNCSGSVPVTGTRSDGKSLSDPYPLGTTTITWSASDAAGNTATAPEKVTVLDTTPPTTTASLSKANPADPTGQNGWFRGSVQVTLSAADVPACSTIAHTFYRVDGTASDPYTVYSGPFTVSGDGQHTVSFYSTDTAGNSETAKSVAVNIDATSPALTFGTPSPFPNAAGWNNTNVSIPFTAADATSGVASTNPSASPLVLSTQGSSVTGTVMVTDGAGNTASFTSPAVKIDKTPPTTTASASGPAGANGWYTGNVSVTLTATDSLSGVARTTCSLDGGAPLTYSGPITIKGDGRHTVQFASTDVAGNVETTRSLAVNIDTTKPTLNFGTPAPAPNAAGWNNTPVSIPFTPADSLSGVAFTNPPSSPLFLSAEGKSVTGTVSVTDVAGNAASFTSPAVKIDLTPPTIKSSQSPKPNANGWNNSAVTITFTASDSLSGVAGSSTKSVPLSQEGKGVVAAASFQDVAGNTGTVTASANIDLTPPTITCPANVTASHVPGKNYGTVNPGQATSTDSLSGVASIVGVRSDGKMLTANYPIGKTTITWTATDLAGNSSSCTQTVTVN